MEPDFWQVYVVSTTTAGVVKDSSYTFRENIKGNFPITQE